MPRPIRASIDGHGAPAGTAQGRNLYVGGAVGIERYAFLADAIEAAAPGDTIHLEPGRSPYRQSAEFRSKAGESGSPIVLDGHGATLLGCDPLDAAEWEALGAGLWRSTTFVQRLEVRDAMVRRFFFVFDGEPQYMGGANKHQAPVLKPPIELTPGEWTYLNDERAFYVRLHPGQTLADAAVEAPVRSDAVALSGDCAHIVVRNVKACRVWNDGFNIHDRCRDIVFENIEAIQCGDDGLSAHEQCEIAVRGFVSYGNANGICHVQESRSVHRKVRIIGSRAHDLYLLNASEHAFEDITIDASTPRGVVLTAGAKAALTDVVLEARGGPVPLIVESGASLTVERGVFHNVRWTVRDASVSLTDAAIDGPEASLTLDQPRTWQIRDTRWAVHEVSHNGESLSADDLPGVSNPATQGASPSPGSAQRPDSEGIDTLCTAILSDTRRTAAPEAILFDMDDTLVATAALWRAAETRLLQELGHGWSEALALRYKGMNALDVAAVIHRLLKPPLELAVCQQIMRSALLENFERQPLRPMSGAVDCVHRAGRVAPLALASGSPPRAIELVIDRLGLTGRFQAICSSEQVQRGKPHPDVFLAAASRLGVAPDRCLVLEDSVIGAQAARAAGMTCFAVPSCQPHEIAAVAHRVFTSLAEIREIDLHTSVAHT